MSDDLGATEKPEVILPDAWEKMTQEQREQVKTLYFEGFQSPLLPPEVLERYGNVIPGLDEKLVAWSEEETKHRRHLENAAFEEAQRLRARSSQAGPFVAVVGIAAAAAVAAINQTASGATAASVIAIVSVGGPFAARMLAARLNDRTEKSD